MPALQRNNARMQVFYATQFVLQLPPGHRFPMVKYAMLRDRLIAELADLVLCQAEPASDGELALVHVPSYIRGIADGSVDPRILREIGFPWSDAMADRARRSVGATLAACRAAIREGVAANIAGGTHHAYAERGGGFCVFNDAAVAARLMQVEWARQARGAVGRAGLRAGSGSGRNGPDAPLRVAVIDLDVHQGNGTARIFQDDPSVFTLSVHGDKNFPFRKETSDLDVALPDGCGDDEYLAALEQALLTLGERFDPGLVIYLAGADPHEGDRLGRLKLSFDGLEARDRRVMDWAHARGLPLAMAMAGGYGVDIEDTVQVQVNTFAVAAAHWQRWQNRRP
jgi:acetoin utilization deacetylase AcuC-like enzyme